jgi:hypothetical protein
MTLASKVPIGCYGCTSTKGLLGWVIRRSTGSAYNHAFIFLGDGSVIEASAPEGVRIRPLAEYTSQRMVANTIETMNSSERAAVVSKARELLAAHDTYNWDDLGAIGLQELGIHWRLLLGLLRGGKKALICSEFVALCGAAAGLNWRCGRDDPLYVTPADLARRPQVRVVRS